MADGLAYVCQHCGMTARTDDLTFIGRNCPASYFESEHAMVKVHRCDPADPIVACDPCFDHML